MEKEATIEEKIRIRKKARAKERAAAGRRMETGQPAKKKRKVDDEQGSVEVLQDLLEDSEEDQKAKRIPPTTPQKRKVNRKEEPEKRKAKRFKKEDMRGYITCKRWEDLEGKADLEEDATSKTENDKTDKEADTGLCMEEAHDH